MYFTREPIVKPWKSAAGSKNSSNSHFIGFKLSGKKGETQPNQISYYLLSLFVPNDKDART